VLSRVALRHIEPFDSMALAAVLLALVAIAVVGCLLPARRRALLHPLAALRAE
jgi:ABC-type lipoprotein release transport system permease subunit